MIGPHVHMGPIINKAKMPKNNLDFSLFDVSSKSLVLPPFALPDAISTCILWPPIIVLFKATQDSLASLLDSMRRKAYPGGFWATHIASTLPKHVNVSINCSLLESLRSPLM